MGRAARQLARGPVNLSARVEYACIAVLELASRHGGGEPVRLRTIAETHGIPSPFLVQILLQLKAAGLVESTRGAAGGYHLSRDPAQVTLAEVRDVIEGAASGVSSNLSESTPVSRALLDTWREANRVERQFLSEVTFGQLVERLGGQPERMYYI